MKEKENNKHCITFNINTKKYFIPFSLPIACTCIHFFQESIFEISKQKSKLLKYNLPLLFYYFLPKIFTIFFIPIINSYTKGESKKEEENTSMRRYHFYIKNNNTKKIFMIIFLISFLEVIYKIDDSILNYLQNIKISKHLIEKRTGFIIFVPLFSYYILNKKLYSHHIFALVLAIIGASIINMCRFFLGFSSFEGLSFIYHIINIFFSSLFSLSLVLIKYLMIKYFVSFISVNMFLFYDGIMCIINLLILVLLEYLFIIFINDDEKVYFSDYISNNYLGIFTIFKEQNWKFYVYFFFIFISSFSYFVLNILTIYYFSPYLNVLTDFITPFLTSILKYIFFPKDENESQKLFYETIGYLILFIGALILNEIIILNFFGFNENTYQNIVDRGKSDYYLELDPNANNEDNNSEGDNEGEINSNAS